MIRVLFFGVISPRVSLRVYTFNGRAMATAMYGRAYVSYALLEDDAGSQRYLRHVEH